MSSPAHGSLISLERVTYTYPASAAPALRDFCLDVQEGEMLLVAGASGSGKSTLLRLFNGLVPHFHGGTVAGRIRVAGRDPVALGPGEMSSSVGLVFQDPEAQFVADVVEDEIAFGMENAGLSPQTMRPRIDESLRALSIEHLRTRRVSTLSGGEKQRVAIAAVLTMRPRVLALDEPTSQLDPRSAEEVLAALEKLNRDLGLTVILSEHRLERVVQHVSRILYLESGGTSQVGSPRDVLATIPLAPPVVQVARLLGWQPLPLSVAEGHRFVEGSRSKVQGSSLTKDEGRRARDESRFTFHVSRADDPPRSEHAISIEGVTFSYGAREVLRDLTLSLEQREITALMGPNGSGKTTLLKLALGLVKPGRGIVLTLGRDTRHTPLEQIARGVGYVPQQPDLLLFAETVAGEIDFTRRAQRLPPDGKGLIDRLGLARYSAVDPRDLSVGERQRVALAAVLAGEPRVLVLDEPTRGLDYAQKEALASLLESLREQGTAILLATHDVELAARLAGRVVILDAGQIVAAGPTREVLSGDHPFSTQVARLFNDPALLTVEDVA